MPNPNKYDLDYSPASYWGPQDIQTHYGSRIKGELRRASAIRDLGEGIVDEGMLQSSLSREERRGLGSIHPCLMGGEYLPDLLPNEVEIARVVLKSTMMDVQSIRARRTKRRIVYRIVDEYGDMEYVLRPKTSTKPLTLRRLIAMIDGAVDGGLVGSGRDWHYDDGGSTAEEIYNFETASSAFYPQLAVWYDAVNEEWLERVNGELAEAINEA